MWTREEHERFLDAVVQFGRRKQTRIAECIGTRTVMQVISHS